MRYEGLDVYIEYDRPNRQMCTIPDFKLAKALSKKLLSLHYVKKLIISKKIAFYIF